MDSVAGRVVLVTGAARGIGAATARALVGTGASVALLDVDGAGAASVAESLGERALAVTADVTRSPDLDRAVAATLDRFGGIDAVVANAGVEVLDPLDEIGEHDFQRVIDVNLVGVWRTVRATLPAVRARRGYYLVVSSLSAVAHSPLNGAYGAAKAGAVALAKTLRLEAGAHGVAVGISYLTYTDTETARRSVEDPRIQAIMARVPGARLAPLSVEHVAAAYVRAIARRQRRLLFDRSSRVAVYLPEVAAAIGERLLRLPATEPAR